MQLPITQLPKVQQKWHRLLEVSLVCNLLYYTVYYTLEFNQGKIYLSLSRRKIR